MRKNSTLLWIYFWGILTLLFACLAESTKSSWTFIIVIITFFILVLGIIFGLVKSSKHKRIRHTLGKFLDEGLQLRRQSAEKKAQPSEKEVKDWTARIEMYLTKHCGEVYVSRFRNDAGLGTAGVYLDPSSLLYTGLSRLNEFISEFRD